MGKAQRSMNGLLNLIIYIQTTLIQEVQVVKVLAVSNSPAERDLKPAGKSST